MRTTAARPGQVVDVVVLSSDAGLLEALRDSAGSEHALWDAPSADSAVDHLVGGRCDVLITDLGSLRGDVAALIVRLQAQFPELIVMATGRREEEGAVATLISSGRIYRFLHKPVSPARASQFLNAATRRYNELRDVQPVALHVRTIARKRPFLSKALLAATGGGVLVAVIAFVIWQSRDAALPATMQTTHVSDAPVEDLVKSKLGSAQIAYLSGRLIDPRGDNALEYYKAVLALQAENAEAKTGLQKVIDTLEQRVVKALQERNAARVVKAWTALQRAAPNHPRLDALRTQLLALSRTTPKPQRSNVTNAPPTGTSSAPASATVVASAPSPVAENDQAERELAEAIARELAEQEVAAVSNPPASDAPIALAENIAPVPDEPDVTETVAQAAKLKRVREVPPVYPREAAQAGTEGWVQVEFTIAPDGTTQDLQVRNSAPKVVFDRAALDSVSKWRFEPIRKNGAPVAQRAVLQVRFVLGN